MSNDTGGPAFPQPAFASQNSSTGETVNHQWLSDGMTLRDYFAAKAMGSVWIDVPEDADRERALEHLGRASYEMADAMLKARKQ